MKIAIAGYGVEGEANYRYFRSRGEVTIVDERDQLPRPLPPGTPFRSGSDVFSQLDGFDLVVRTAGLSPHKIRTDGKIWSATNEFFAQCPAPIIGVTGTKGKGTTCSLIASVLRAAGKTVHLVGNIGTPALDVLPAIQPDDVVVYELSSFQLWDAKKSPQVAVVLMIEQDHLDIHANMDEYIEAKRQIRAHQTASDRCLYHPTNSYSRAIAAGTDRMTPAARYAVPDDGQVYVRDGQFYVRERAICGVGCLKLPGAHNLDNACAALSAVLALYPDVTDEHCAEGLGNFTGLPHRLKFVAEKNGVKYYDDSIATIPGSAIAAMKSFTPPLAIIVGGSDKGADYTEMIEVAKRSGASVHAIGQTGRRIAEMARTAGLDVTYHEGTMDTVVPAIAGVVSPGATVVLSPASASFDQYASYADRGDKFIAAVEALKS